MGDDPASPSASDTSASQPADEQNRPEPQADVLAPASESANMQPDVSVAAPSEANSTPEPPQPPVMPSSEPASQSVNP